MDAKTYRQFLDAVDIVCLYCHYGNDETCGGCPVRKTCDNKIEREYEEG